MRSQGVHAIAAVFAHMYRALEAPRFVVHDIVAEGEQCFLTWDFLFRFKRFAPARRSGRARRDAPAIWLPTAASRCTATTGTRPRNCTRSCRQWRADALAQAPRERV